MPLHHHSIAVFQCTADLKFYWLIDFENNGNGSVDLFEFYPCKRVLLKDGMCVAMHLIKIFLTWKRKFVWEQQKKHRFTDVVPT